MIRKAINTDLDKIMDIVKEAVKSLKLRGVNQWQNGYPSREILEADIKKGNLYVYIIEEEVAAFAYISKEKEPSYDTVYDGAWLTKDSYAVVHRIAVNNSCLGRGIAKKMFEFAFNFAKENNLASVRVDTHPDNIPMNNLLIRLGFARCGIIHLKNYIDQDKIRVGYEYII